MSEPAWLQGRDGSGCCPVPCGYEFHEVVIPDDLTLPVRRLCTVHPDCTGWDEAKPE